jgi:ElaB/YqjD/DUF883 family membrane-anchored ribosome-binding protein
MSIANDIGSTGSGSTSSGTPENTGSTSMPQGREMSTGAECGGVGQSLKHMGSVAADKATQLKDSAQEYLQAGKERAQEYLHAGKDRAQEYLETGKEKAHEYYEMSKAKAQEWENTVEQYIREKPLQSVLMAAGVGALVGFLLRR